MLSFSKTCSGYKRILASIGMCHGFGGLFLFGRWMDVDADEPGIDAHIGITVNPSLVNLLAIAFINTAL